SYTYDSRGNLTAITDPLDNRIELSYESKFNRVASIKDRNGSVSRLEYDAKGNVARTVDPLGAETKYVHDGAGNVTSITDPLGRQTTISYDSSGNATEYRDDTGATYRYRYDNLSRATGIGPSLTGETRFEYDAAGRPSRVTGPAGDVSTTSYDRDGLLQQLVDPDGKTTRFQFGPAGLLAKVTDAAGVSVQYGYGSPECGCGSTRLLREMRTSTGASWSYTYDSDGLVSSATGPLGGQFLWDYDARGNAVYQKDPNGNTLALEYDSRGRPVRRTASDGVEERYTWDANGNLLSAANADVTVTFEYDARGLPVSVADSRFPAPLRYTYDKARRRTAFTDATGGVTTYTYGTNGKLASITPPFGQKISYTYDTEGRLTGLTNGNGVRTSYGYDTSGRVTRIVHSGSTPMLQQFDYAFDKVGQRTSTTGAGGVRAYRYDDRRRLITATGGGLPDEAYQYDDAGNRVATAADSAFVVDAANRLLSTGGASFEYDANGNMTRKTGGSGAMVFTYNALDRLIRIDLPAGGVITYKYDPFGRRIERARDGAVTRYLYDWWDLLSETDGENQTLVRYVFGPGVDGLLVQHTSQGDRFFQADALGSITLATGSDGGVLATHSYDSFGNAAGGSAPLLTSHGFTGRQYDPDTGLYDYRARFYDPSIGRFLSPDPFNLTAILLTHVDGPLLSVLLPGGDPHRFVNDYVYVANDPVNRVDPSGMQQQCAPKEKDESGDAWKKTLMDWALKFADLVYKLGNQVPAATENMTTSTTTFGSYVADPVFSTGAKIAGTTSLAVPALNTFSTGATFADIAAKSVPFFGYFGGVDDQCLMLKYPHNNDLRNDLDAIFRNESAKIFFMKYSDDFRSKNPSYNVDPPPEDIRKIRNHFGL
ncbi:MAG: hypothetical protein NTY38_27910, partial [Acidobacteria bacterium]|nr:hypothetical protein [Acidobacteriota bacterium]